jgi:hypothetical protein
MTLTDLVPVPAGINSGLTNAKQATMLALLGSPRKNYTDECQDVTHEELKHLQRTESVGPFRATGLAPALESLRTVIDEIRVKQPEVHAALGTAGMLCARLVRGSHHSISNHAWGTAIDLRLNGILDRRGDNRVQRGLVDIAPIFNRQGWFWGAGFGTEDAMHFEISDELIRKWSVDGTLSQRPEVPPRILVLGDRGPEVANVQERLNQLGFGLKVDGIFGPGTRGAVSAFQASKGLLPDGVVGPATLVALGLR